MRVVKQADGTWTLGGSVCVPAPAPAVGIEDVRARLVRLVPGSGLSLAPEGTTLVNIQTIMWVAAPAQRTLGPLVILGHRVAVRLAFDRVSYDFGDATKSESATAGRSYDRHADPCKTRVCPGYDGHIYAGTGTRTVTATVSWRATFAVDGGRRIAIPGTVAGPTARTSVVIRQARGVLVPDPGGR